MKHLLLLGALAAAACTLKAQAPAVIITPTEITTTSLGPNGWTSGLASGAGGKLLYYLSAAEVRVYNRTTRTTAVVLNGSYVDITASAAGDKLALLRPAEGSRPGADRQSFVWTVAVNPDTGIATSEPRRVGLQPALTASFSPDGKSIAFIATSKPAKLVVVPASGGPDRTVYEHDGLVAPVQWSPDGKQIYVAQPFGTKDQTVVMARVPAEGGPATVVTPPVAHALPGVTPDGRFVIGATRETTKEYAMGVFDPSKRSIASASIPLPAGMPLEVVAATWTGNGSHVLTAAIGGSLEIHRLGTDGSNRVIPLGDRVFATAPSLSPDGKLVALAVASEESGGGWDYSIMNVDGTNRRTVHKMANRETAEEGVWSPDSRYVAFSGDFFKSLYVADASTGKTTKVGSCELNLADWRWRPDSRTLIYIWQGGTATNTRVVIHEATVTGQDRVLRDITAELPANVRYGGSPAFMGGDNVLLVRQGLVVQIAKPGSRKLYDAPADIAYGIAADGARVAIAAADRKSVEVISIDGRSRQTLAVPMGSAEKFFLPADGRSVIMTTKSATNEQAAYLVPLGGDSPRLLLKYGAETDLGGAFIGAAMAPGGELAFGRLSRVSVVFHELDFAAVLRGGRD